MSTTLPTFISTVLLSYSKVSNTFTVDASRLGWAPGARATVIDVQSHKTEAIRRFIHTATIKDREGDIIHWEYRCERMILRVFND